MTQSQAPFSLISTHLTSGGALLDCPPCPICITPLIRRNTEPSTSSWSPYCVSCEAPVVTSLPPPTSLPLSPSSPSAVSVKSTSSSIDSEASFDPSPHLLPPSIGPSSTPSGRHTSGLLGSHMLGGWTMLGNTCLTCNTPMVRKDKITKCVNQACNEDKTKENKVSTTEPGGPGVEVEFREENGGIRVGLTGSGGGTPVAKGFLRIQDVARDGQQSEGKEVGGEREPSIREMRIAMEENRLRRERDERSDGRGVGKLGERMLAGWAMLAESCEVCMTPMVGRGGVKECVNECGNPNEGEGGIQEEHFKGEEEEEEVRDHLGSDPAAERMGVCLMRGGTMTDVRCVKCGGIVMRETTGEEWCSECEGEGGEDGEPDVEDDEEFLDDEEALVIQARMEPEPQPETVGVEGEPYRAYPPKPQSHRSPYTAPVTVPLNIGGGGGVEDCYETLNVRLANATNRISECEENMVEGEARKIEAIARAMKAVKEIK